MSEADVHSVLISTAVDDKSQAVEHDAWFRGEVRAGIDSANADELIAAEDVEAEAVAWRVETRSKLSGASS